MKHPSLPQSLTPELLASWISQNAKEKFTEEKKYYYTEDELNEFKDSAVKSGIELNNLAEKKARLNKIFDNGTPEYINIDITETKGIKALKEEREANERQVERGYKVESIVVYGIPNQDTHYMDYFDIEGNEIPDRTRPLSAKEIREYVSQFKIELTSKQA
jgi:hypothetical protein